VIGSPTALAHLARRRTAISVGVPAIRCMPRTSRNASSIDSPRRRRRRLEHAKSALLASEYADMRGARRSRAGTAAAPAAAHRRPTPHAFAS
jgi:hypothetical protein